MWATDQYGCYRCPSCRASCDPPRLLDVRSGTAAEALAEEVGALDILFNCAGYVHPGDIFGCTFEDWELSLDINVTSMYRTCRAFLRPCSLWAEEPSSTCPRSFPV